MSYYDKFGRTQIVDENRDNLSISWDYQVNPDKIYPVLLYTPDMANTNEHFHIDLTKKEATILKEWLETYLKENK